MSKLVQIHPINPEERKIKEVVDCLKAGGVIIYPTDSVYGLGCDIFNTEAIERIAQIRGFEPGKVNLSFVCHDLSQLSDYTLPFDKWVFKMLNRNLPGAFTFILKANKKVPKLLKSKRETVGIRVPDNKIARSFVEEMGNPLLSISLKGNEDDSYLTNPELIYEAYKNVVEMVIDGGIGSLDPSTVVDCTGEEANILRQGKGELIL